MGGKESNDQTVEIAGHEVVIRPIRHSDNLLVADLVRHLSAEAMHYRFLGAVRELSQRELEQLCDVDHHHAEAFIALVNEEGHEREIGMARYCEEPSEQAHELALTIADDYRKTSLGEELARRLVSHARQHGIRALFSIELNDNHDMRALSSALGMSMHHDPDDANQVIYRLDLAGDKDKVAAD